MLFPILMKKGNPVQKESDVLVLGHSSKQHKGHIFSSFEKKEYTHCTIERQSELPRPIKIRLGCVCGVELCTKLQHSVSRKCEKKVLYHV